MKRLSTPFAAIILLSWGAGAEAAGRYRLDVPGGTLGDAIVALGRQAGVSIGVSDPALAARLVPPVRGSMSVDQALKRMLAGRGATFVAIDADTFRIVRQVPNALPPLPQQPASLRLATLDRTNDENGGEAIIVTGARRPVRLRDYPGLATIIPGDDPEFSTKPSGSDAIVSRLPAVASTHLGPGRNKLFIRGIADSSFNGPTQATAGQYLGETRLNYNAPDPDLRLYDLERIEVLQGPQGTLYGAGSLGGIIRIVPNRPRLGRVEGAGSAGVSFTEHGDPGADAAGMINLPIVEDRLAFRGVAYATSDGGYIDDAKRGLDDINRVRTVGGRAALRFATNDDLTIDLGGTAQHIEGRDGQFADRDAPPLTRFGTVDQPFSSDYLLGDLTVTKSWGDTRLVTSVGAVRQEVDETYDSTRLDTPPQIYRQQTRTTLLSAESRLSGGRVDGASWLLGASFIDNSGKQRRAMGDPEGPRPLPGVSNGVREAALFGEGSVPLGAGLIATLGGRITHSRLSGQSLDVRVLVLEPLLGEKANRNQTAFLPSLALSYQAAPDLFFYTRYQEGFRPGGLSVTDNFIRRFRSDDVSTLEGGVRFGDPARDSFDAVAAIAYTRWKDIQADTVSLDGFPTTTNIGNGRIYTFDFRIGWRPAERLGFELAGVVNDSEVTNPLPSIDITEGAPLPNVARFSGRLGANYGLPVGQSSHLSLNAAARYTGRSRLGIGPILGRDQGNWLDISFGARLDRGAHSVSLTLTNLLDEEGNRFALGSPFTVVDNEQITPLRPRTLRLGWQLAF